MVLAVTVILASLLFPALGGVRETANRMMCGSNQRQIGMGITLFANDWNDELPASSFQEFDLAQEMMAVSTGTQLVTAEHQGVEGLGRLLIGYLDTPSCLYCPSHTGDHEYCKYKSELQVQATDWQYSELPIYINYHYAGHLDPSEQFKKRRLDNKHGEVLVTDGLRTLADFNHDHGANTLHGDGAVVWVEDAGGIIKEQLPKSETLAPGGQWPRYQEIWELLGTD